MKKTIILSILLAAASAFGQGPKIKKDSTVYVAPMHGYEAYIIAALQKEHVPVVVILDRYKAQYIIGGVVNHKDMQAGSSVVVNNNFRSDNGLSSAARRGYEEGEEERRALGETSASISVLNPKTTAIIFSYTTDKMGKGQLKKNAEDFAKHLKKFIEKGK